MIKLDTGDDFYGNGESVLAALSDARIFSIDPEDGQFCFTEGCDSYFSAKLTRDQVLLLADELRALVAGDGSPA